MAKAKAGASKILTPLGIVAVFVTLTETVLGMALTQVTGGVQVALTVFVIVFALLVAGCFFGILWSRPYVFYSPAEYGDQDPALYAKAMRSGVGDEMGEKIQLVGNAESKPHDRLAQFQLADALIEEPVRQFLILMHEKSLDLPILPIYDGIPWKIVSETNVQSGSGFSGTELSKKIGGSKLIEPLPNLSRVRLTNLGHEFAEWLIKEGKKSRYFHTKLGEWGEPTYPQGFPKQFKKDFESVLNLSQPVASDEKIIPNSDKSLVDPPPEAVIEKPTELEKIPEEY